MLEKLFQDHDDEEVIDNPTPMLASKVSLFYDRSDT
jgi:hypothetical protein